MPTPLDNSSFSLVLPHLSLSYNQKMACTSTLFILTALLALTMPFMAIARPLMNNPIGSHSNFAYRLKLDEESSNCWDSLFQLQACTGEVILFFVNGETYLGHGCCEAIKTIEQQCWPALLGSLGFTTQETDVLKGYCNGANQVHTPPLSPSSPPPPTGGVTPLQKWVP